MIGPRQLLFLAIAIQMACAGNVETVVLRPGPLTSPTTLTGVLFYPPQFVKLTYAFTVRVDKDGKVVGNADSGTCKLIIQREDVVLFSDLDHPMLIKNASGGLSASKFAVTLNSGMLASVNSEPAQKLSDLLTASVPVLKELAGVAPLFAQVPAAPSADACTTSPRLIQFAKQQLK